MKIAFHQYKIPKMVEVFVRCGKHEKYRKLGYFQPNDNSQSNYLHKEIKTVFFEFPCTFIRLVLHQNYKNELNLFDQVALSEIIFEGECLPSSALKHLETNNLLDDLETSEDEDESQPVSEIDKSVAFQEREKRSLSF